MLVDPIHSVIPSTVFEHLFVAGTKLVLEKTEMKKMFSLPSNNLQALAMWRGASRESAKT